MCVFAQNSEKDSFDETTFPLIARLDSLSLRLFCEILSTPYTKYGRIETMELEIVITIYILENQKKTNQIAKIIFYFPELREYYKKGEY